MDEAELEEWFEERRDTLEYQFRKSLETDMNDSTALKKKFDFEYRQLIKIYQKKQEDVYVAQTRRKKALKSSKEYDKKIKDLQKLPGKWLRKQRKLIAKWLFDIKFKWTVLR